MGRLAAACVALAGPAFAQVALEAPASVVWHGPTRSWFVSNSGRRPGADRPTGWIARLDAGDKRAEPVWVDGLVNPRGMAVVGDLLFVADGTDLALVDIATRSVKRVAVPRARQLHGIAAGADGEAYVSDTLRNAIYRVPRGGAPEVFLTSDRLQGPTGLAVDGGDLIVATWGVITDPATLATRAPGRLFRIGLRSKAVAPIEGGPTGNLDGLALSDGTYVVTDRRAGKLMKFSTAAGTTVLREGLRGPGGIGLEPRRKIMAVPEREGTNVTFLSLN
jgi:sugar lactone lactonase YvrE